MKGKGGEKMKHSKRPIKHESEKQIELSKVSSDLAGLPIDKQMYVAGYVAALSDIKSPNANPPTTKQGA